MKSTQISSMFIFLTETEEASLCGGNNPAVPSVGIYGKVIAVKGSAGKPGAKKQTVQSTTQSITQSTTKVVKITKGGKIPQGVVDLISSLMNLF